MTSTKPVVVLVAHNSSDDLARVCPVLAAEPELHVLVADNASSDDSADVVRATLGEGSLVETGGNLGYAAAINRALEDAPRGPVVVLNPDVELRPCTITDMVDRLGVSGAGILVGHTVDESGSLAFSLRREPSPLRTLGESLFGGERSGRRSCLGEMIVDRSEYVDPRDVDWATGSAMAISAECREAVGEWNEEYFLYSEETEYMARAREAGFAVRYDPAVEIVHRGGEQLTSPPLYALGLRNKVLYMLRRRGRMAAVAMRLALSIGELLRLRRDPPKHKLALRTLWRPQAEAVRAVKGDV